MYAKVCSLGMKSLMLADLAQNDNPIDVVLEFASNDRAKTFRLWFKSPRHWNCVFYPYDCDPFWRNILCQLLQHFFILLHGTAHILDRQNHLKEVWRLWEFEPSTSRSWGHSANHSATTTTPLTMTDEWCAQRMGSKLWLFTHRAWSSIMGLKDGSWGLRSMFVTF